MLAPVNVKVPLPLLLRAPSPEMIPEVVPEATERVLVEAIATEPPLRVVMLALPLAVNAPPDMVEIVAVPEEVNEPEESVATVAAPLTLVVPPEILAAVVCPRDPAVTVPEEIALFNAPVTLTVPAEIPLVMVALLPKLVLPAPESVPIVTVPDAPLKFTALAVVLLLLVRVPTVWPAVPEMSATPVPLTVKLIPELKFTASSFAPEATVMPDVPPRAPAAVAARVPALIVVAPE